MRKAMLRLLLALHARGLHAAVLAALVVMPTVATVGYLTRDADRNRDGVPQEGVHLRPTLPDPAAPVTD